MCTSAIALTGAEYPSYVHGEGLGICLYMSLGIYISQLMKKMQLRTANGKHRLKDRFHICEIPLHAHMALFNAKMPRIALRTDHTSPVLSMAGRSQVMPPG